MSLAALARRLGPAVVALAAAVVVAGALTACTPQTKESGAEMTQPETTGAPEPSEKPLLTGGGQLSGAGAPEGVDPAVWRQVQIDLAGEDLVGKDGPLAKVGRELALVYREYQAYLDAAAGAPLEPFAPSDSLLRVVPDDEAGLLVAIEAVAADDPAALLRDLEALGMQNATLFGRIVSGLFPVLKMEELAALETLQFARPVMAATQ